MHAVISDSDRFMQTVFKLDSFIAQKTEVDRLHLTIAQRITALRAVAHRTKEEDEELERLEIEDKNLQEYKKRHMVGSPILMYLHGIGCLSSPRGIGGSVTTYDLGIS